MTRNRSRTEERTRPQSAPPAERTVPHTSLELTQHEALGLRRTPVRAIKVDLLCQECGEPMQATGSQRLTCPPQTEYACPNGHRRWVRDGRVFPTIVYEPVAPEEEPAPPPASGLKPCPFCGRALEVKLHYLGAEFVSARCTGGCFESARYQTLDVLVEAMNRRAER